MGNSKLANGCQFPSRGTRPAAPTSNGTYDANEKVQRIYDAKAK